MMPFTVISLLLSTSYCSMFLRSEHSPLGRLKLKIMFYSDFAGRLDRRPLCWWKTSEVMACFAETTLSRLWPSGGLRHVAHGAGMLPNLYPHGSQSVCLEAQIMKTVLKYTINNITNAFLMPLSITFLSSPLGAYGWMDWWMVDIFVVFKYQYTDILLLISHCDMRPFTFFSVQFHKWKI